MMDDMADPSANSEAAAVPPDSDAAAVPPSADAEAAAAVPSTDAEAAAPREVPWFAQIPWCSDEDVTRETERSHSSSVTSSGLSSRRSAISGSMGSGPRSSCLESDLRPPPTLISRRCTHQTSRTLLPG